MAQQDPYEDIIGDLPEDLFAGLFDTAEDITPFSKTEQGRREAWIDEGFTGTFDELIKWMDHALMNGHVRLAENYEANPLDPRRRVRRLELVSGGFSTAELAMARLRAGTLGFYWESSHRGGLDVYLVPEQAASSDRTLDWVLPASNLVLSSTCTRQLIVLGPNGPLLGPIAVRGLEVLCTGDPDVYEDTMTVRVAIDPADSADDDNNNNTKEAPDVPQ